MPKRGKPKARGHQMTAQPQKAVVSPLAQYNAASQRKRTLRSWNPPPSGPNQALQGLQMVRNRHRDVERNDWAGESSSQKWATALIGIGITPRFKRIKSDERRQVVADLFDDFSAQCDAHHLLNVYGLQTLAVRTWFGGGECFARRRYRRLNDGLAVPMQVELLEADMVPLLTTDVWPGLPAGNKIKDGIEYDKRQFKRAMWFYKEHPGDAFTSAVNHGQIVRVPIEDVAHICEPKRPGQRRGVPPAAVIIERLKETGEYEDTVLTRQKIANMFVAFLTRALPTGDWNQDNNVDPLTGQAIERDTAGGIIGMQPGIIQELDDGQGVTFANPPEAGTTYSDYIRTQHLGTAAASGLPYELFSGDIKEISDRTLRVLINEFRRFAEQRQWQILIPQFCQKVVEWFADAALLAGKIAASEYDSVRRVEHAPHGWAHIHPVQDPQGQIMQIDAGLISRSSVIGARGDDPIQVDLERRDDKERADKLGLTPPPPAPAGAKPGDKPDPNDDERDDEQKGKQ